MILKHAPWRSFVDPFLSLIKSILVQLATHLFISQTVTFFHLGSAHFSPVVLLFYVWLRAYSIIVQYSTTRVTLACKGNSASVEFQDLGEVLSLRDSPRPSTLIELGDVIAHSLLYAWISMDALTRTKFQRFKSNPPLSSFKKLIVSPDSYMAYIQWVLQRLFHTVLRMVSVEGPPDANVLWFPMSPRNTLFKRRCLPARTRVSRLQLEKPQNYVSPSGILGCAKPFSCTWDQLWMQSRNKDISRPTKKPKSSTWSNEKQWSRQRMLWPSLTKPPVRGRKFQ